MQIVTASSYVDIEIPKVLEYIGNAVFCTVIDPKNIQGNINDLTWEDKEKISSRAKHDATRANEARQFETDGDQAASIKRWGEILESSSLDMIECEEDSPTVRQLCNCYFDRTKWWWWLGLFLKLVAFVMESFDLVATRSRVDCRYCCDSAFQCRGLYSIRSNYLRSTAETLLRKLDFQNSFGWAISEIEIADVVATLPSRIRNRLRRHYQT